MSLNLEQLLNGKNDKTKRNIGMRKKLFVYMFALGLGLFSLLFLILNALNVVPGIDSKIFEMIRTQQQNQKIVVSKQIEGMLARNLVLSKEISQEMNRILMARGDGFSAINNNPELINELEKAMYMPLKNTLDIKYCSGVFAVLDATANTQVKADRDSRMGLYLRFADLKSVNTYNPHIVYFRGSAEIARQAQIEMHNRWDLEFDTQVFFGSNYDEALQFNGKRLVEGCHWQERTKLEDTWENVQLLYVPILDSTGKSRGVCGMEISDLYFKLSYPATTGHYGKMITALAPLDNQGRIALDKALLGGTESTYLPPEGSMTIEKGKYLNVYTVNNQDYIGIHDILKRKYFGDSPLAVMTLLPEHSYAHLLAQSRRNWMIGSLVFIAFLAAFSLYLSNFFAQPIIRTLKNIQKNPSDKECETKIAEVDELIAFIQAREKTSRQDKTRLPSDIEAMLNDFALRVQKLTPAERNVLQYYIEGNTIEEIAELLYISIGTARKHNTNMNKKLGIRTKEELILYIDLFNKCDQLDQLTNRQEDQ